MEVFNAKGLVGEHAYAIGTGGTDLPDDQAGLPGRSYSGSTSVARAVEVGAGNGAIAADTLRMRRTGCEGNQRHHR